MYDLDPQSSLATTLVQDVEKSQTTILRDDKGDEIKTEESS